MKDARNIVVKEMFIFNHKMVQVSITWDRGVRNPSELHISMTLVVNNLPQHEAQMAIAKSIRQISEVTTL